MDVEVISRPVFCLKLKNLFSEKVNKKILDEAISLEKDFKVATTVGHVPKKDFRTNHVIYYDEYFKNFRTGSDLLINLDKLFNDMMFKSIMSSSPYPLADFSLTNKHETQVSRYGYSGQKYDFHVDKLGDRSRFITLVYYFFKDPKKWTGGEIQLTNSPINDGIVLDKNAEIITIIPENNMGLVFAGNVAHRVLATKSPKDWGSGRFSSNIWIGIV